MAKEPKLCLSGSGGMTKGGEFAPGGDAKYKSALISRVINPDPSEAEVAAEHQRLAKLGHDGDYLERFAPLLISKARAKTILKDRDWTKFLDQKVEALKAKDAKDKARAKAAADRKAEAAAAKAETKAKAKDATPVAEDSAA